MFNWGHPFVIGGGYTGEEEVALSCLDQGYDEIIDEEDCIQAIIALGGMDTDSSVISGAFPWIPKGCTMEQGSATVGSKLRGALNAHISTFAGTNNNGAGGYILICKESNLKQTDYYVSINKHLLQIQSSVWQCKFY